MPTERGRIGAHVLSPSALAAVLGAVHLLVDATTVASVFRAIPARALDPAQAFLGVVAYDVLAFAGQAPLGLLLDAVRARRVAAVAGVLLAALGLASPNVGVVVTVALAGLGNALFHAGAGAEVLERDGGRAAPAGVFVAPGALGLAIGLRVGGDPTLPVWPLGLLCPLAVGALAALRTAPPDAAAPPRPSPGLAAGATSGVVGLCLVSVVIRSFIGFAAPHGCPRGTTLLVGLPVAAFAGKLAGGFVADRVGWIRTGVGTLLASAPLVAFGGREPWILLAGLLLFQMTMPLTLVVVSAALPGRAALAFGLPCLALAAGALPTFFEISHLYGGPTFLLLVLVSAAALWRALRIARSTPAAAAGR